MSSPPRIVTAFGVALGTQRILPSGGPPVDQFLGLPYASPPTGALRFAPPVDWTSKWPHGSFNASSFGPACLQFPGQLRNASYTSEDCLSLNVWRPTPSATTAAPKAVMVWIHGGGYTQGCSSEFDGALLASAQDVIVVSFNYRLGPLGFFTFPAAGNSAATESTTPSRARYHANFGVQDMQSALRFIRSTIASFGGDRGRVMIFGQSAGGGTVTLLMHSPASVGLFHTAAIQSGGVFHHDAEFAAAQTAHLAAKVGCVSSDSNSTAALLACLRRDNVSAATLVALSGDPGAKDHAFDCLTPQVCSQWSVTIDGAVLPESPLAVYTRGEAPVAASPFIFGSNTNDSSLFLADTFPDPSYPGPTNASEYARYVRALLYTRAYVFNRSDIEPALAAVLELYPADATDDAEANLRSMIRLVTDLEFVCSSSWLARVVPPRTAFGYRFAYNVSWTAPCDLSWPEEYGVPHTAELSFVFATPVYSFGMPTKLCSFSPTDERISATMSGTWAAFSKSGGSQPPSWPSYNAPGESAETVVVDAFADGRSIALEQGYRSEQCALWRKLWAR